MLFFLVTMMDMKHIRRVNKTLFFYKYVQEFIKLTMLSKDIKGITEAYVKMYQTEEVIEEEILDEIFEELVAECIEEGFTEEEACQIGRAHV